MTIQFKDKETCISCIKKNELPPCGVNSFRKGGELEDVILDDFKTSTIINYIVCPVDAIKPIKTGVKILNDVCISCGLCVSKCPYDNMYSAKDLVEESIYKNLKNDVLKTTSFLHSKLGDKFEILTGVKADGNARNKRIDIVINFTNKIYFIKVLSSFKALGKYERSYSDILKHQTKTNREIEVVFLYCEERESLESVFKDVNEELYKFTHISIDRITDYIIKSGGN